LFFWKGKGNGQIPFFKAHPSTEKPKALVGFEPRTEPELMHRRLSLYQYTTVTLYSVNLWQQMGHSMSEVIATLMTVVLAMV